MVGPYSTAIVMACHVDLNARRVVCGMGDLLVKKVTEIGLQLPFQVFDTGDRGRELTWNELKERFIVVLKLGPECGLSAWVCFPKLRNVFLDDHPHTRS